MAGPKEYMEYVIGLNYSTQPTHVLVSVGVECVFKDTDTPENWGMRCIWATDRESMWSAGCIQTLNPPSMSEEEGDELLFKPYWWCRQKHWLPLWGNATKQRAKLMTEMRAYWANKWFSDTIPKIVKALIDATTLPVDVINLLPPYFAYPHQMKKLI